MIEVQEAPTTLEASRRWLHPVADELRRHPETDRVIQAPPTSLPLTSGAAGLVVWRVRAPEPVDADATGAADGFGSWVAAVLAECHRVLEPGGRLALVAPTVVSRRPYRNLAAEVAAGAAACGFLAREEVVWVKEALPVPVSATPGVRMWLSPHNPPTTSVTERIMIWAKDQLARCGSRAERSERGLPCECDQTPAGWQRDTFDIWSIPASSEDAGLPGELVERLVRLHTYRRDLVVDPICGSGGSVVAVAAALGRRIVGADTDPAVVARAEAALGGMGRPVDG